MVNGRLGKIKKKYESSLYILRGDDDNRWKGLEEKIESLPTAYQLEMVRYQSEYFREKNEDFIELSTVIRSGAQDIGIWPLCLIQSNFQWGLYSCGAEVLPPGFIGGVLQNAKTRRKYLKILYEFMMDVAIEFEIKEIKFQESVMDRKASLWHRYLMEAGASISSVSHDSICDLSMGEDDVNRLMHKTTVQRIKQAYDYYDYEIIDRESGKNKVKEMMEKFRLYHKEIAGRTTRGIKTWEWQIESIMKNRDFMVFQYDKATRELCGATLFTVTHSHCYYSVSAYDRERFNKAIGHQAQHIAIKRLRELGVRFYVVGDRYYESDGVDLKNIHISDFKEAFGTELWLKLHLTLPIGTDGADGERMRVEQ